MTTQNLRTELRMAHRALIQEIGEDAPIQQILKSESGWKGRSEQIVILKDKLRDMTKKLSKSGTPSTLNSGTMCGTQLNCASQGGSEAVSPQVTKLDLIRRKDVEKANYELEKMKSEHVELKTKCDALAARNRILEREIKEIKAKAGVLIQKGENDNKYIDALQAELDKSKVTSFFFAALMMDELTSIYMFSGNMSKIRMQCLIDLENYAQSKKVKYSLKPGK